MKSVPDSEILLYTSPDGEVQLDVRMQHDTMWMTQQMMAELFQTTVQNIIMHVRNIYKESELQREGKPWQVILKANSRFSLLYYWPCIPPRFRFCSASSTVSLTGNSFFIIDWLSFFIIHP